MTKWIFFISFLTCVQAIASGPTWNGTFEGTVVSSSTDKIVDGMSCPFRITFRRNESLLQILPEQIQCIDKNGENGLWGSYFNYQNMMFEQVGNHLTYFNQQTSGDCGTISTTKIDCKPDNTNAVNPLGSLEIVKSGPDSYDLILLGNEYIQFKGSLKKISE